MSAADDLFGNAFGDIFKNVGRANPDADLSKIKERAIHAYKKDIQDLDIRRENLVRKAQNQNDRSYNKGLKDAVDVEGLTLEQVEKILGLQVEPRYKEEFGG